jgi:hypothetical protein
VTNEGAYYYRLYGYHNLGDCATSGWRFLWEWCVNDEGNAVFLGGKWGGVSPDFFSFRFGIPSALYPSVCGGFRKRCLDGNNERKGTFMITHIMPLAAIGFSLLYLLLGGGFGGAILIFIVAKMLGK